MFTHLSDFDRTFDIMDALFRRVLDTGDGREATLGGAFPARLFETDDEVVLSADLPGIPADAVEINLHDNVLTIAAQRQQAAPEGYTARRIERGSTNFSRSFSLPARVDSERTSADLSRGVLTVRMAKAEDARPRRISISA